MSKPTAEWPCICGTPLKVYIGEPTGLGNVFMSVHHKSVEIYVRWFVTSVTSDNVEKESNSLVNSINISLWTRYQGGHKIAGWDAK